VLLISDEETCIGQETVAAVPIRTMPPPFPTRGLVRIEDLKSRKDLTGFIRCDLPIFYPRSAIGKLIHHFTDPADVEAIDAALRAAFGL
jgi:hypothetical protein